jgi:hypothetical protein
MVSISVLFGNNFMVGKCNYIEIVLEGDYYLTLNETHSVGKTECILNLSSPNSCALVIIKQPTDRSTL